MGQIFERAKMATLPPDPPPPSTTSPTEKVQANCFPTASRSLTNRIAIQDQYASLYVDDSYRRLGTGLGLSETHTLAFPLLVAHLFWSPAYMGLTGFQKSSTPLPTRAGSSGKSEHSSSCCSKPHDSEDFEYPRELRIKKMGTAFVKCKREMQALITWDRTGLCFKMVEKGKECIIDNTLREFGYYEDANGKFQKELLPQYSTFTTGQHGHDQLSASGNACVGTAKTCSATGSKYAPTVSSDANATAPASTARSTTASSIKPTGSSAGEPTTAKAVSGANKQVVSSATKPARSATHSAKPARTPASASKASTATAKPISARGQQKKKERTQPASLLSDCQRFSDFAASNSASRTHMSAEASLKNVVRELNRTVLRFNVDNGDNPVSIEVSSLVAILNYAVAFYVHFACGIEKHMGERFDVDTFTTFFAAIYGNRAEFIEREEFRSEGCPADKSEEADREQRRFYLEDCYHKLVPDATDLRDGIQTVLFTFVWINYTAHKGYDIALTSTLHIVIPLLQTVVTRCARQTTLMKKALEAAGYISAISETPYRKAYDLQSDLLVFSSALQNLSGCGLALFTSSKRNKRGWKESLVNCPYSLNFYTTAVADMTLRALLQLDKAIGCGTFCERPKRSACSCYYDNIIGSIEEMTALCSLIERKQYDWKPEMRKKSKSRKGGKKKRARGSDGGQAKDIAGKDPMIKDILTKRIDTFEQWSFTDQDRAIIAAPKAAPRSPTSDTTSQAAQPASGTSSFANLNPPANHTPAQLQEEKRQLKRVLMEYATSDKPDAHHARTLAAMEEDTLDAVLTGFAAALLAPASSTMEEAEKPRQTKWEAFETT